MEHENIIVPILCFLYILLVIVSNYLLICARLTAMTFRQRNCVCVCVCIYLIVVYRAWATLMWSCLHIYLLSSLSFSYCTFFAAIICFSSFQVSIFLWVKMYFFVSFRQIPFRNFFACPSNIQPLLFFSILDVFFLYPPGC